MKHINIILFSIFILFLFNCAEKETKIMLLQSDAFTNGALIPTEYSCEGDDITPYLEWSDVPINVESFALTCVDPDAPVGEWIHWIAWNIPADLTSLNKGIDTIDQSFFTQGTNSWGLTGYGGPCPPVNHGLHRYYFSLYALNTELDLDSSAELTELKTAIDGHVISTAVIMGKYER